MDEREMRCKKERIFENSHSSKCEDQEEILSIKVTDDEHVPDSKALPELVKNIIKSDSMTATALGKLFADGAYDDNEIFRYLTDNGIFLPCIKVRKRMLELDGKREKTSLEIYQL